MSRKIGFSLLLLFPFFFFLSCREMTPLGNKLDNLEGLNPPSKDQDTTIDEWGAPKDLKPISGYKKEIPLSWKPVKGAQYYLISYSTDPFADFSVASDEVMQIDNLKNRVEWTLKGSTLSPLEPGGVYYFKIRAVDKNGNVSEFSDLAVGGLVDEPFFANTIKKEGEITLRWTLPNLATENMTYSPTFKVYEKTGDQKFREVTALSEISQNGSVYSFSRKELIPKTEYKYRVDVSAIKDDAVVESPILAVTTLAQPFPNQVQNFTVSQGDYNNKVVLNWTRPNMINPNLEAPILEYTVTRIDSSGMAEILVDHENILTYEDTTAQDQDYSYEVKASFEESKDKFSPIVRETGYKFFSLTSLWASPENSKIKVNWIYPEGKKEGVTYTLKRVLISEGTETDLKTLGSDLIDTFYFDEDLDYDKDYRYIVSASRTNSFGDIVSSPELKMTKSVTLDLDRVELINELSATQGGKDSITLQWQGIKGAEYKVIRDETEIAKDIKIGDNGLASYEDGGLNPNETFSYSIVGLLGEKSSQTSDIVTAYTMAIPEITAVSQGLYDDKIELSWDKVKGATSYNLYSKKVGDGSWNTIHVAPTNMESPAYNFTPEDNENPNTKGLIWEFKISARNDSNDGSYIETLTSEAQEGCTLGPALLKIEASKAEFNDKIHLSWNQIDGATKYKIYRSTSNDYSTAFLVTSVGSVLEYDDNDTEEFSLTQGGTFYYFIMPLNDNVSKNKVSQGSEGYALSPPRNIRASQFTSATSISLNWDAVPGATGYTIYIGEGDEISPLVSTSETSKTITLSDNDIITGKVRKNYTVSSHNSSIKSRLSDPHRGSALSRPLGVEVSQGDKRLIENGKYYTHITWPRVEGAQEYIIERLDDRLSSSGQAYTEWKEIGRISSTDKEIQEYKDFNAFILEHYKQKYRVYSSNNGVTSSSCDEREGFREVSIDEFTLMTFYTLNSSIPLYHCAESTVKGDLWEKTKAGKTGSYKYGIERDGFFGSNYQRYYDYVDFSQYFLKINGSFKKNNGGGAAGLEWYGNLTHRGEDDLVQTRVEGQDIYSGSIKFNNPYVQKDRDDCTWTNKNVSEASFTVKYNGETKTYKSSNKIPITIFATQATARKKTMEYLGYKD